MKISKVCFGLFLIGIMTVLFSTVAVPEAMAITGHSGEGDDCYETWVLDDLNPPFVGTLIGWQDYMGRIFLYSPIDSEGNPIPLERGGAQKCEIVIPEDDRYNFGVSYLPEKPKDIRGFCRTGLKRYDNCSTSYPVAAYQVINASNPKYIDDVTFSINVVIMPLQLISY
jgi:hypothetical protein